MKRAAKPPSAAVARTLAAELLVALKRVATKKARDGMARYAIPSDRALGVPFGTVQKMATTLAPNHALAQALWDTGVYEARLMASMVDDPALVTSAQMDRWRREFDNWAITDTVIFKLFDRAPAAWKKVEPWSRLADENGKRAAFVLLACLALHDKEAPDQSFLRLLPLVERAATDNRNFVKKGVNWALRAVGGRNAALNKASIDLARRLAESPDATARWIGKDALRALTSPVVQRRLKSASARKKT
jgi:3-methyladenine DNA glycosylase AlkD